jgi:hypothetical protein
MMKVSLIMSLGCLVACCLVAGHLVACHLVLWSFGRKVNLSRSFTVVGLFDRKIIWSRGLLVVIAWSRMSFGRRVIWSRGHLDARSFSCVVNELHGYLVVGHLVAGHLVAGHLVALNEKSILTYLQK